MREIREWIGVPRPARGWNRTVTADAVWHFAAGVGDDNPRWWDADYCAGRGAVMTAPPTFLYSCNNAPEHPGEVRFQAANRWLPGSSNVWMGDTWEFVRPVLVGEDITATEQLVSVSEPEFRNGSWSVIHIDRTEFVGSADGQPVAYCSKRMLRRPASQPSPRSLGEAPGPPALDPDIGSRYRSEVSRRRGARPFRSAELTVGATIGPLTKGPLCLNDIVGWLLGWGSPLMFTNRLLFEHLEHNPGSRLVDGRAGVTETIEIAHLSERLARQNGFAGPYDFGSQRISWAAHLLTDWMGDDGAVKSLAVRLKRPNTLGGVLTYSGTIADVVAGRETARVSLELIATDEFGHVNIDGTATVEVPMA
jgi:acyl dehydratase